MLKGIQKAQAQSTQEVRNEFPEDGKQMGIRWGQRTHKLSRNAAGTQLFNSIALLEESALESIRYDRKLGASWRLQPVNRTKSSSRAVVFLDHSAPLHPESSGNAGGVVQDKNEN
jgi:hypothetical protein